MPAAKARNRGAALRLDMSAGDRDKRLRRASRSASEVFQKIMLTWMHSRLDSALPKAATPMGESRDHAARRPRMRDDGLAGDAGREGTSNEKALDEKKVEH